MKLSELKRQFLEHLEIERGRSLKTIANYDRYLDRFLIFAKTEKPQNISDDMVREFRLWLNRQPTTSNPQPTKKETLKKNTQNYYLIALRTFLKYLARRGIKTLPADRIELAKVGARSLDLISNNELERLLSAPKGNDLKSLRDRAMLEMLFSTGMRVSELVALPRDVDMTRDELSIRGKGEKVRVVFLSAGAKGALKDYLAKRKDMEGPLFIRIKNQESRIKNEDQNLTSRSVERIVAQYAIEAGIGKKVTPHVVRHSFATDLLQNGADLRSVQALLGHAHIATTQVYTHVTDAHLHEIHRAFHGRQRKK